MKLIAKGNTAEIYEYGNNLVCKLFYPEYPMPYIKHEFYNATVVEKLGIKTPKAHKLIAAEGRDGIVYDQILGEKLSLKLYAISGELSDMWLDAFVNFHKQLLQHSIEDAMNYKDFLKMFVTDEETIAKIDGLADGNYLLHGDFHPANVMVDQNDNLVLIDMMNMCRGPRLYDIARTYFLLKYDNNVQSKYLEQIGYKLGDIMPYLDVILAIRKNEMMRQLPV